MLLHQRVLQPCHLVVVVGLVLVVLVLVMLVVVGLVVVGLMLVGLLLMVRVVMMMMVVVVWACQWIGRLESDQEKLMKLTALLLVLLMMIPLMNCATPFDIPFFLGGRPLTSF